MSEEFILQASLYVLYLFAVEEREGVPEGHDVASPSEAQWRAYDTTSSATGQI